MTLVWKTATFTEALPDVNLLCASVLHCTHYHQPVQSASALLGVLSGLRHVLIPIATRSDVNVARHVRRLHRSTGAVTLHL